VKRWWIQDGGLAALRVAVALLVMLHGVRELFGVLLPSHVTWFGAPGFMTDRWMAGSIELLGALLLASGTFSRVTAGALALVVLASPLAPGIANGHWRFDGGELIALYVSVLVAIAIMGPGRFSVDAFRAKRRRPRVGGMDVPMSPWVRKQYRRRELTR
jgi:putative oxidoreductase